MPHEIDQTTGKAAFAYVGQPAWHRLGSELEKGAPIEKWKVESGLNFTVEKSLLQFETPDGAMHDFDNRYCLYRDDTHGALGIVSDKFKIVQPGEVLEFYRDLVEKHDMELETAGALKGGSIYWALARTGDHFSVNGSRKDRVNSYVLLATANDGTMATKAKFTSIRVVCNNTLTMAGFYKKGKHRDPHEISIKHTSEFNADQVKADLGLAHDSYKVFRENVDRVAAVKINKAEQFKMLADIYYPKRDKSEDETAKLRHVYRTLELVENGQGSGFKSSKDTLWGLVNGVTAYMDHAGQARDEDVRLRNTWFGWRDALKNKSWQAALAYAERVGA